MPTVLRSVKKYAIPVIASRPRAKSRGRRGNPRLPIGHTGLDPMRVNAERAKDAEFVWFPLRAFRVKPSVSAYSYLWIAAVVYASFAMTNPTWSVNRGSGVTAGRAGCFSVGPAVRPYLGLRYAVTVSRCEISHAGFAKGPSLCLSGGPCLPIFVTNLAGRCAICASRSRIVVIFAALTACPRRCLVLIILSWVIRNWLTWMNSDAWYDPFGHWGWKRCA